MAKKKTTKTFAAKKKVAKKKESPWLIEWFRSGTTEKFHWRLVSTSNGKTLASSEPDGIANSADLLSVVKPLAKQLGASLIQA